MRGRSGGPTRAHARSERAGAARAHARGPRRPLRGRPRTSCRSLRLSPFPSIPLDEVVRFGRSPGPGPVERRRSRRLARCPTLDDRVDKGPLLVYLVVSWEEGRVAAERVEDERLVRVRSVDHERRSVVEVHVDRADADPLDGDLRPEPERDAFVGLYAQDEGVWFEASKGFAREELVRRYAELDRDLGRLFRQSLSGAQVERNTFPAPVVDPELQSDVGLGPGVGRDARLLAVARRGHAFDEAAGVLPSHGVHRMIVAHDLSKLAHHFDLLVTDLF